MQFPGLRPGDQDRLAVRVLSSILNYTWGGSRAGVGLYSCPMIRNDGAIAVVNRSRASSTCGKRFNDGMAATPV